MISKIDEDIIIRTTADQMRLESIYAHIVSYLSNTFPLPTPRTAVLFPIRTLIKFVGVTSY